MATQITVPNPLSETGALTSSKTAQSTIYDRGASTRSRQHGFRVVPMPAGSSNLDFDDAFDIWIANRTVTSAGDLFSSARYISERTEWDYRQYARALSKMFGKVPLCEIGVGELREYHRARAFCDGSWHRQAGANRIRKEVGMLVRIMCSAGVWTEELEMLFEPLQHEDSDIERPLAPDEQQHFLAVAASKPEWSLVLHYTIAALQTCMSTNELRTLRLGDISLEQRTVTVRIEGAKNKFRRRTIPLESDDVLWAFERLMERAATFGSSSPYHYLFPFRVSINTYDPSRPMSDSGLRKIWDMVRTAAGFKSLRPYDLRHTAITNMATEGVAIAVIMSFAGHMSLKMQQHYTTISMMAKRQAMSPVWRVAPAPPRKSRPSTGHTRSEEVCVSAPVARVQSPALDRPTRRFSALLPRTRKRMAVRRRIVTAVAAGSPSLF